MAIIMTEVEGKFEPDYGYSVEMHIDDKEIVILASTLYNGHYIKHVQQFAVEGPMKYEAQLFENIYKVLREVQRKCERLHEGC
jgi:hypothetical protein